LREFIGDGIAMFDEAIGKIIDSGVATSAELRLAGDAIKKAFREGVAAGIPLVELQETLGQRTLDLIAHMDSIGEHVTPQLRELGEFFKKLADEDVQALILKLEGVGGIIEASIAMALPPTVEAFNVFKNSIHETFEALQEQGLTAEEATQAILPQLLQAAKVARDFGFELDDNTKRLLEQAGIDISLMPPSEVDVMVDGFDRIVDGIDRLIETLGGAGDAIEEDIGGSFARVEKMVTGSVESISDIGQEAFEDLEQSAIDSAKAAILAWQQAQDEMVVNSSILDISRLGQKAFGALEAKAVGSAIATARAWDAVAPGRSDAPAAFRNFGGGGGALGAVVATPTAAASPAFRGAAGDTTSHTLLREVRDGIRTLSNDILDQGTRLAILERDRELQVV
jgi:hypothetical protein